ncbi:MAG: hypothetical protein NT040_18040 [Bacteroidetes bacterium]|nr:hypothetical protein [Bacteroidota bacterium]
MILFWLAPGILAAQSLLPGLYNSTDSLGLYSIDIEINSSHFSGLLLLKKMNDSTIRLVMNSEMGPKLVDLELMPSGFRVLYAFPKLNNRRTLRILYEDFGALAGIFARNRCTKVETRQDTTDYSYVAGKKMKVIYSTGGSSQKISSGRLEEGKGARALFCYVFTPGSDQVSSMKLEHQQFRMIISLTRI